MFWLFKILRFAQDDSYTGCGKHLPTT